MHATTESSTTHDYTARVLWTGNRGDGTSGYSAYGREYVVSIAGKPDLPGSADPIFRGDAGRHNPEDLFVASIASCHMLLYLSLCARAGIRVIAYEDGACGRLELRPNGGSRFAEIVLRPAVTVDREESVEPAMRLHETSHARCFIAASCSVPIRVDPAVRVV